MMLVHERPYTLAINEALAELVALERVLGVDEIRVCMTRHVRARTHRQDVVVWVSPSLEWWITYSPSDIALEPWEADLIEGVMTPEEWVAAGARLLS